ncbi:hypothetical protein PAPYR_4845 [Paratrimastix pyriformis]|uniref:Uncharacterized protein n=1 Tax=Paratrimastix pyriformis TaxID=342808 RepID=A0ABQ8UJ91_9EUKA|nr:hypothetical protein PAPYR_4845 [Paratrimastix pyriformis]
MKPLKRDRIQHPRSPLLRLPLDLLPVLVQTSDSPLRTYAQLLSLCHATRTAIRGTPRELSFFSDDDGINEDPLIRQVTTPTPDALAALVGPCLSLVKLTLDVETLPPGWCGCVPEAAPARWVTAAFAGHDRLAVLEVTTPCAAILPDLPHIVGHLHGLEEFRLRMKKPIYDWEGWIQYGGPLLASLGQSCPRLQLLHLDGVPRCLAGADLQCLAPIAGTLKDVHLPVWSGTPAAQCEAFLGSLTSVQKLSLSGLPVAWLRVIAPQLTQFCFDGPWDESPGDIAGLCRLARLELSELRLGCPSEVAVAARLLRANAATLRSVDLAVNLLSATGLFEPNPWPQLADLVDCLPPETALALTLRDASVAALFVDPPVGLLDRLEQLTVHIEQGSYWKGGTIRIASRRLRTLRFVELPKKDRPTQWSRLTMELACPRLETLALPEVGGTLEELHMDCPQLRSITGLPCHGRPGPWAWGAMPHLVRLLGIADNSIAHLDLPRLLEGSPRLREVPPLGSFVPGVFTRLLESCSLTRLSVDISVTALPILGHRTRSRAGDLRALRLPAQLERLEAKFHFNGWDTDDSPPDLLMEGAGLRSLTVQHGSRLAGLTICCPALVALDVPLSDMASLTLVGRPSLLSLTVAAFRQPGAVASLPKMIAASTRLRRVALFGWELAACWPRLAAALGRLPQLAVLHLANLSLGIADLALACPALRRLTTGLKLRSLVLDCPLLELLHLGGFEHRDLVRFEMAGPVPPNLELVTGDVAELATRFPWVRQIRRQQQG